MKRRKRYRVPGYALQPEYQLLAPGRLLCLMCARVIGTHGKPGHEQGIEHKSAMAEWRSEVER